METLLYVVGAALVGGVFSYLFFRANPRKKAAVDQWVEKNKPE